MDLVKDLPFEPEPEYADMVTVFEGNSNSAAVTSTTLANAGIESWVKDEGSHDVFPNLGPVEVQVRAQDQESALKAIGGAVQNAEAFGEEDV